MNRFLQDAANMLDVAINSANSGRLPSDVAVLIGADGSLRMICDSEWSTDGLRWLHGTAIAYRVSLAGGVVRVTGEEGGQRCILEAHTQARVARRLLGTPKHSN